eukprot:6197312-Pleurochrysis_carterae.AAC.2
MLRGAAAAASRGAIWRRKHARIHLHADAAFAEDQPDRTDAADPHFKGRDVLHDQGERAAHSYPPAFHFPVLDAPEGSKQIGRGAGCERRRRRGRHAAEGLAW